MKQKFFLLFGWIFFSCSFLLEAKEQRAFSLEEAVREALQSNKQLLEMERLVERAHLGRLVEISEYLPKLEAMSQAFQSQHSLTSGSKSSFLTQLTLAQTIFSANKYYNIKIAGLVSKQLEILQESAVNDVLYQTRQAFYLTILDQKELETAQVRVEILKTLATRMEERYRIGTATSFDVNQSQVAVANSLATYYERRKKLKVSQNAFSEILGFDPGTVFITLKEDEIPIHKVPELERKLDGEIFLDDPVAFGFIYPPSNPEKQRELINHFYSEEEVQRWEKIALDFRPNLKNAENTWKIAQENVKKARGEYFPKVEFAATYGGLPTPYDDITRPRLTDQSFQWSVGVTLKWNIFDSLKRERKIREAKAKQQAEKFSWDYQVQQAYREVRDQMITIENAAATNLSAKGNMRLAEQTLAQAGEQVEIGYISIFDYQISVNNFIEAKNIFYQSQFELIDAYYGLRHATGIDVEVKRVE